MLLDILPHSGHRFSGRPALVCQLVAYACGVATRDLASRSRAHPRAALARQVAMYLCHTGLGLSQSEVARLFGRDRSTVGHAARVIEDRRDEAAFDAWLDRLEAVLKAAPAPHSEAA